MFKYQLTFSVQQLGKSELLLSNIEGIVQVVHGVAPVQLVELNQVGSVLVYNRVERQPVAPRGRKVAYVDVVVAGCLHLTPQQ